MSAFNSIYIACICYCTDVPKHLYNPRVSGIMVAPTKSLAIEASTCQRDKASSEDHTCGSCPCVRDDKPRLHPQSMKYPIHGCLQRSKQRSTKATQNNAMLWDQAQKRTLLRTLTRHRTRQDCRAFCTVYSSPAPARSNGGYMATIPVNTGSSYQFQGLGLGGGGGGLGGFGVLGLGRYWLQIGGYRSSGIHRKR